MSPTLGPDPWPDLPRLDLGQEILGVALALASPRLIETAESAVPPNLGRPRPGEDQPIIDCFRLHEELKRKLVFSDRAREALEAYAERKDNLGMAASDLLSCAKKIKHALAELRELGNHASMGCLNPLQEAGEKFRGAAGVLALALVWESQKPFRGL